MVEVRYIGRLGNNLFQYCFARILAQGLGYKLKAEPIAGFPNTKNEIDGYDYSRGYPVQVITHDYPDHYTGDYSKVFSWKNKNLSLEAIFKDASKRKIVVEGYFQRYEYYKPYKDIIKNNWLLMDMLTKEQVDSDSVVVHVRRGDYNEYALPFSYYKEALSMLNYKRIFLCTDNPSDPFFLLFRNYKPIIHHTPDNPQEDFQFIMKFNKIIQSASSFSWWASFLSNATEIYTPVPLVGPWSYPDIDLKVDDENRYKYISCRETYKKTIMEETVGLKIRIESKVKRIFKKLIALKF